MRAGADVHALLEYLPGGDLDLLVDRNGAVAPAAARFYIGCVALGLEALHAIGVVHRDIKPDNVCIGADGYAKIADLGFSRSLGPGERARTLLGTPEYLSPEAFLGEGQDAASDMWSLGVTLYVVLLDSHPHGPFHSPQDLYRQVLEQPPFFPNNIISSAAKALVQACMQRDASARPTPTALWEQPFFTGPPAPISSEKAGLSREALLSRSHAPPFVPRLRHAFDTSFFLEGDNSDDEEGFEDANRGWPARHDAPPSTVLVLQPGGEANTAMPLDPPRGAGARRRAARNRDLSLATEAQVLEGYAKQQCDSAEMLLVDSYVA